MSEQTLTSPHNTETSRTGWATPFLDILTVLIPVAVIAFAGVFLGGSASGGASLVGSLTINFAYLAAILIGGWLAVRFGIPRMLAIGQLLQIAGLVMLWMGAGQDVAANGAQFGQGFLRLALRTGSPIIPFGFIGGERQRGAGPGAPAGSLPAA